MVLIQFKLQIKINLKYLCLDYVKVIREIQQLDNPNYYTF